MRKPFRRDLPLQAPSHLLLLCSLWDRDLRPSDHKTQGDELRVRCSLVKSIGIERGFQFDLPPWMPSISIARSLYEPREYGVKPPRDQSRWKRTDITHGCDIGHTRWYRVNEGDDVSEGDDVHEGDDVSEGEDPPETRKVRLAETRNFPSIPGKSTKKSRNTGIFPGILENIPGILGKTRYSWDSVFLNLGKSPETRKFMVSHLKLGIPGFLGIRF